MSMSVCVCVCVSVCLSVCPRGYLRNHTRDLYQIFVHVAYVRGSVLYQHVYDRPPRGFLPCWKYITGRKRGIGVHSAGKVCYLQLPCYDLRKHSHLYSSQFVEESLRRCSTSGSGWTRFWNCRKKAPHRVILSAKVAVSFLVGFHSPGGAIKRQVQKKERYTFSCHVCMFCRPVLTPGEY